MKNTASMFWLTREMMRETAIITSSVTTKEKENFEKKLFLLRYLAKPPIAAKILKEQPSIPSKEPMTIVK